MSRSSWTLLALVTLGGTAAADAEKPAAAMSDELVVTRASARGIAEDYLVLPSGGELTGQLKFVTADQPMWKFSDVGLFGLTGRWSLFTKLEVSGDVELLPKQPSSSHEHAWQSVGFGLRSPLGEHTAIALSGGGGHLISHTGMWTRESLMLEWKKPIDPDFLSFDIQAGLDGLGLSAPDSHASAYLTEVAVQTAALFREPHGHWGGWVGVAYAVPVQASGRDPTTDIAIDPQPRLDFHMGSVLSLVKDWDLYVDFAVIDRGDADHPATRLPILDGGFDQRQIMFGVTRHLTAPHRRPSSDSDDRTLRLGAADPGVNNYPG